MIPRTALHSEAAVIARYILGTARSRDGRGVHQNEVALLERLRGKTTPTIAMFTASAARRVGEAIAARAKA